MFLYCVRAKRLEAGLDILSVLDHKFYVLEAFEARLLSQTIISLVLDYAPDANIRFKQ